MEQASYEKPHGPCEVKEEEVPNEEVDEETAAMDDPQVNLVFCQTQTATNDNTSHDTGHTQLVPVPLNSCLME